MSTEKSKAGGEFFTHTERSDGTRDLYFGKIGDKDHGHAVIEKNGNVRYLRESDGRTVADDRK